MKFGFIAKHRIIWPAAWLCGAMGVSRSGSHAWLNRSAGTRSGSDEAVGQKSRLFPATEPTARGASGETFWQTASNVAGTGSGG